MATEALGRLASAGDRERAIERLRAAAGQLGLEELEQRLDTAVRARSIGELAAEVSAQGDGFLARFGSSCDAVRCGIEVQRRLRDQREDTGFAPGVRIGLHAGEAVEETGDLLGTVINMAARVTTEAQPAEVLITEAVADQLDGRFELEDRGLRTLKGLSRPRHLVAVRWAD